MILGRPLYDKILLRRTESEKKHGSLYIPETSQEKPLEATVVAVGSGRLDEVGKRIPMEVRAGDRVLVGKYAGTEIKIDNVEHIIVREEDVLMVLDAKIKSVKVA